MSELRRKPEMPNREDEDKEEESLNETLPPDLTRDQSETKLRGVVSRDPIPETGHV